MEQLYLQNLTHTELFFWLRPLIMCSPIEEWK